MVLTFIFNAQTLGLEGNGHSTEPEKFPASLSSLLMLWAEMFPDQPDLLLPTSWSDLTILWFSQSVYKPSLSLPYLPSTS